MADDSALSQVLGIVTSFIPEDANLIATVLDKKNVLYVAGIVGGGIVAGLCFLKLNWTTFPDEQTEGGL